MKDPSRKSSRRTSKDVPGSTSSRASAGGTKPSKSQAGRKTVPSGPDPVHVSRFRARDRRKAIPISDTSGPLFSISSKSHGLQSFLESRFPAHLGENGCPLFAWTWRHVDMPVGSSIYRLFVSIRSIGVNVFGLWRTPTASDDHRGTVPRMDGRQEGLPNQVPGQLGLWGTPRTVAWRARGEIIANNQDRIEDQVLAQLALWGTPRAKIHAGTSGARREKNLARLEDQIFLLDMMAEGTEVTDTGIPPYWFRVRMDARGRYLPLNPEFTRWLMGYPSEWDAYVPMGTRSSRKLARDSLNST